MQKASFRILTQEVESISYNGSRYTITLERLYSLDIILNIVYM